MTMMSAGGMGGGVASAVARAIGAGRERDADDYVLHAIVLAVIMGLCFTIGSRLFARALFEGLGAKDGALDQALAYSDWLFLSAVPIWTVNLCSAALRGAGNVKTPAIVSLAGVVILICLSPVLIFGLGPIPGLGIAGAGIAVTLFYTAAAFVLVRYLRNARGDLTLKIRPLRRTLFRDVLGVGVISSLSVVQLNLAVILVTGLIGRFGEAALAGYGIGSRLEYLFIPILFGLGSAVLMMVGTCIGAGDLSRAKRIIVLGTLMGAAFTGVVGIVILIWPKLWLGIFSNDAAVLDAGTTYLRIVVLSYPAIATSFILSFASQGTGRPGWPTLAGTVRLGLAAGVGWIAVEWWNVGLPGLSMIIAGSQLAAAAICLGAVQLGLIWRRSDWEAR
jgi:putative MATE family efflux protein